MQLQDKVVILTWASEGIGEQITLRLAKEGAHLALIARNENKLQQVSEQALKLGAKSVRIYPLDLSQVENISKITSDIETDFGSIDILINNAWIWQKMMELDEVQKDDIDSIIATNLSSVVHLTHSVLPILRKQSEGIILNIVSQSWVVAQAGQSIYTATKYGVRGFTDVLKADLKGSNVRVAGVYQAGTRTKMFETQWETMPLEKFADPADLADIVCYMLSQPPKIWMHEVRVTY